MIRPISPEDKDWQDRLFVDPEAPEHLLRFVELVGDDARLEHPDHSSTEWPSVSPHGLDGVFVLFSEELESMSASAADTHRFVQSPAVHALLAFTSAASRAGVSAIGILEAATDALRSSQSEPMLPSSDADFLEKHGDVRTAGPGEYARIRAEQSVRDAAQFVSTDQVAALLGIDKSRVRHRKGAGILISHKFGRELRYPVWQFSPQGGVLPGLAEIKESIDPSMHPAELAAIMTTPQVDLKIKGRSVSPRDWLIGGGDIGEVRQLVGSDVAW